MEWVPWVWPSSSCSTKVRMPCSTPWDPPVSVAAGVLLAHVDGAVQAEQRARGRGGHAVLAGPGLRDHPRLAHPPGQQHLAQHVVDLVRPGVGEILALEQHRAAGLLAEPGRAV